MKRTGAVKLQAHVKNKLDTQRYKYGILKSVRGDIPLERGVRYSGRKQRRNFVEGRV